MAAPGLDFLVIGAPKAGTTSLHEYLGTHPELLLPEAKEQQFFSRDVAYEEGWDAFAAVAFRGDSAGRHLGKVSPHYLGGPAEWRDPSEATPQRTAGSVTAARIAALFPAIKLIALLRDPVERAISSYWQAVVLEDESRPIDRAFGEELEPAALDAARRYPRSDTQYVALGEYGRLLEPYVARFPRDQLFIGATSELGADPRRVLGEIWRYLGIDDAHVPPNLGQRFQTRGTGSRSRLLSTATRIVNETPGLRRVWRAAPSRPRDALRARIRSYAHRVEQRSTRSDPTLQARPAPDVIDRLRSHYAPDLARLEELVGPVAGVTR